MLNAQTSGSLLVVGACAASELSARLLDAYPGWGFAWYLHLEVFRPFEVARAEITPLNVLLGPEALAVDLVLIAVILLACVTRFRFGVAFLANLSFGIAVALAHAWLRGSASAKAASLVEVGLPRSPESVLIGVLLVASFVAFLMSHLSFLKTIALARRGFETGASRPVPTR